MKYRLLIEPVIAGILFGLVFVAGKHLANTIPPAAMSFLRYAFASAIFIPVLIKFRTSIRSLSPRQWRSIILASFFGITGYHILFYWALHFTAPTNVSLIHASNPILTLVLSGLILKDKIKPRLLLGFVLAVVGIMIVVSKGSLGNLAGFGFNTGELLMLCATIIWAIYTILLKRIGASTVSPLVLTALIAVIGWITLAPLAFFEVHWEFFGQIHFSTWVALAYMGIGSSGLGYFLYTKSAQSLGPALTSLIVYTTVPIVVSLVSFFWLHIPITGVQVVGFIFILAGLSGALKPRRSE